jgi:hypothetical protein
MVMVMAVAAWLPSLVVSWLVVSSWKDYNEEMIWYGIGVVYRMMMMTMIIPSSDSSVAARLARESFAVLLDTKRHRNF